MLRASPRAGDLHDIARAVALGEEAVRVTERQDPVCLETLAELYQKAGESKHARRVAWEALKLPDIPPALMKRLNLHLSDIRPGE